MTDEINKKIRETFEFLSPTDYRFSYSTHLVFRDGSSSISRAAFAVKHEDYLIVFFQHRFVVHNIGDIVFYANYKDTPVLALDKDLYILAGYIDKVEEDVAFVTLIDESNQQRYHTRCDYDLLQTLYGVERMFRVAVTDGEVRIWPVRDIPIPDDKIKEVIDNISESLKRSEKQDG